MTDPTEFFKDFISGGTAAAVGKTVVGPFERIKLILQVQDLAKQIAPEKRYKGMADALIRIPKEEGFFHLWRGNLASIYKYFPLQAFSFSFKELFSKHFIKHVDRDKEFRKYFVLNLLSGGMAGVVSVAIVYPLDYARTRLATDMGVSRREFKGIWDCLAKTANTDGIKGLYRGFVVSSQGYFIYRAIYFGVYDSTKGPVHERRQNIVASFILAQLTTIAAGFFSYPFDTVRRRIMMQAGLKKEDQIYKNTLHCWVHTFQTGGIKAFFRGSIANVVRATGGAVTLVLYDEIRSLIE